MLVEETIAVVAYEASARVGGSVAADGAAGVAFVEKRRVWETVEVVAVVVGIEKCGVRVVERETRRKRTGCVREGKVG
jgi:hypothetical protein